MQRYRQTLDEIVSLLSEISTSCMDDHALAVIKAINSIPDKQSYTCEDIGAIFDSDYHAALTTVRLALGMSQDEFGIALKNILGEGGTGINRFKKDRYTYLSAIRSLGVLAALAGLVSTPVGWRDILIERLKYGRGSAIKGQKRGRSLEDFAEAVVKRVFAGVGYDTRCRFVGATGTSTEKADFAIPSKKDPRILIESKAYGATGSKQTDVLGDIERIVTEKRPDTHLLLVTDGVTWRERLNDLRKLVEWQNEGRITRIYTQSMAAELEADLRQLRKDHSL